MFIRMEAALRDFVFELPPSPGTAATEYVRMSEKYNTTKKEHQKWILMHILDLERIRICRDAKGSALVKAFWKKCLRIYGLDDNILLKDLQPPETARFPEIPPLHDAVERLQQRIKLLEKE